MRGAFPVPATGLRDNRSFTLAPRNCRKMHNIMQSSQGPCACDIPYLWCSYKLDVPFYSVSPVRDLQSVEMEAARENIFASKVLLKRILVRATPAISILFALSNYPTRQRPLQETIPNEISTRQIISGGFHRRNPNSIIRLPEGSESRTSGFG